MEYQAGKIDVAVIGAGHAGIEAALAAARLGCSTVIFTINMDAVGNLPCNPSIGGTAKGHLVREIDALGGEMGKVADKCTLQSRMLNRGKGPAVHSLRAQVDRRKYSTIIKQVLEKQENLLLRQAEVTELRRDGEQWEVVTKLGAVWKTKSVILATGTYLGGKIFVGETNYSGGPDGMFAATELTASLLKLNIPLRRFKTGTPARVLKSSIDYSRLEVQAGDERVVPFSYSTKIPPKNTVTCSVAWTNEKTKEVILKNLNRSPLYGGEIKGVGPRYCPSIEDKIVRFSEKERHQCFIEPCGGETEEMYLQGLSTSLPEDVQIALYRTMSGLENVQIMRSAYAIEYDCVDPTALKPTLEFKNLAGLYGAGQFNGSSGYEEAAAQGLVAGISAARRVKNLPEIIFKRSESYIGTLIDDLVTKGVTDPYRMMTSRSEYRLILRQDNVDRRLTPVGREIGLIDDERWESFNRKLERINAELKRASSVVFSPNEVNELLVKIGSTPVSTGVKLADLIKRPEISYDILKSVDATRPELSDDIFEQVEIELKYEGYIKKQLEAVEKMKKLENKLLSDTTDYMGIDGLRLEARDKLNKIKPASVGQAARISGISPADIQVLLIWLKKNEVNGNDK